MRVKIGGISGFTICPPALFQCHARAVWRHWIDKANPWSGDGNHEKQRWRKVKKTTWQVREKKTQTNPKQPKSLLMSDTQTGWINGQMDSCIRLPKKVVEDFTAGPECPFSGENDRPGKAPPH